MDQSLYQLPPQNIEAEESLLSAILVDNSVIPDVSDILTPDNFYKTAHKLIFDAIIDMHRFGDPVDLVTIVDKLRDNGNLEKVGGATYVSRMMEAPLAVNAIYYAKKINKSFVRRELIMTSQKIMAAAYDITQDIEDVVEASQKNILSVNTYSDPDYSFTNDMVVETIERYEELHKEKILITGVPTGFTDIDKPLSGMQKSDLIILAGRPSMGKTAISLQFLKGAAEAGYKPFMFSLEQPSLQLMDRLFAAETKMSTTSFRSGRWLNSEWMKISEAAGEIVDLKIGIDDRGAQSWRDICKTARIVKKKHGIDLIVVDHLGLVGGAGNKSRNDEIGLYTRQFKALAKELKIPVVLLSQLNRGVEERSNKRPMLSDLRDSGNIEQDADVVIFIYRDEVYDDDENNPNRGRAEIIIAKQRQGPICMVPLAWIAESTRFEQLARRNYE